MPSQAYWDRHLVPLEPQYRHYQDRWDSLEAQGWKFKTPENRDGQVGMTIFRGDESSTFYVPMNEKAHRKLLEKCEAYAFGTKSWRTQVWERIQKWIEEH